jgi:hypothetical protein
VQALAAQICPRFVQSVMAGWQAPSPLQRGSVSTSWSQLAAPQLVPAAANAQPPVASQPARPQGLPPVSSGQLSASGAPFTGVQAPMALQTWQVPSQLVSQHTPSAQWPEAH